MRYFLLILVVLVTFSCREGDPDSSKDLKQEAIAAIEKLEGELKSSVEVVPNRNKANTLIEMYVTFVNNNPEDPNCADYMFKAGELSMGTEQYKRSIGFFEKVRANYPSYEKVVESMYLIGFIYDNYLNQKGMAETKYKELIEEYPRHEFTVEARAAINNLYLTDEELIERFETINKTPSEKAQERIEKSENSSDSPS